MKERTQENLKGLKKDLTVDLHRSSPQEYLINVGRITYSFFE